MALRKFVFMTTDGFSEEASGSGDSLELGGLKMYGAIDANSNVISALASADADGEALAFGQSGANLSGLSIDTSALTMGGQKITGLGAPTGTGDAATKDYVDEMVVAGGHIKEEIWSVDQLSDTEGIRALEALYFAAQPVAGDTVVIKNATVTKTYTFVANQGAEVDPTDVSIESSAATAMQRLVTRINADADLGAILPGSGGTFATMASETMDVKLDNAGSWTPVTFGTEATIEDALAVIIAALGASTAQITSGQIDLKSTTTGSTSRVQTQNVAAGITSKLGIPNNGDELGWDGNETWTAIYETNHDDINDPCVGIYEDATAAGNSASRIYGVWGTQASLKVVEFATGTTTLTIRPYYYKTAATAATSDPGYGRFGMRREDTALTDGEMHLDMSTDNLWAWNADATTWFQLSGPGSVPLATSASGGGVVGRVTFDQDKGLKVTSGIAEIQLKSNYGLMFETTVGGDKGALMLKLDDTPDTLDVGSAGLAVTGLPSLFKINDDAVSANVTANNLDELTGGGATTLHTHAGAGEAERTEYDYTVAEALAKGDPAYITAAGTAGKALANTDAKSWVVGIARTAIPSGSGPITFAGRAAGVLTTATPGDRYYLAAAGGLVTSAPSGSGNRVIFIGVAASADDLLVRIQDMGKRAA